MRYSHTSSSSRSHTKLTNVHIEQYLFTICLSRIIAEDRLVLGLTYTALSLAYDKTRDG